MTALVFLSLFISLIPLDESGLEIMIQENRGSVLVVNFWATWCGPCREEFPDLVQLYEEKRSEGLRLASISMDEPEEQEAAQQFLIDQQASFPSYIRNFEDFAEFVDKIDPEWSGALPATFIFDRNGKRAFSNVGKVTYSDLLDQVQPLLEARSDR
jgi:thiol-disulfide isomerase/thioredoxin